MPAQYAEGTYWGRVTHQQLGESKEKKTPQFVLTFSVLGKINPNEPDGELLSCPAGTRSVFRYFTDKTIDFVVEDVRALCAAQGITNALPSWKFLDPSTAGYFDFTGAELAFFCKHEEYQGEYKEKWSLARGGGKPDVAPLDDRGIRQLDSLFGKKLRDTQADAAPKKKTPPPADEGPMPWDETEEKKSVATLTPDQDIPF